MGFLDNINPFRKTVESLTGTLDTWVDQNTLDKDLAAQIKAKIALAEIEADKLSLKLDAQSLELEKSLQQSKETSYQLELQTVTYPKIDALHKMGRQILSLLNLLIPFIVLVLFAYMGVELTEKHMLVLFGGSVPSAVYNYRKGKGHAEV